MSEYVSKNLLLQVCDWYEHEFCEADYVIRELEEEIKKMPIRDLVHCMNCYLADIEGTTTHYYYCRRFRQAVDPDGFCKWGKPNFGS